MSDRSADASFHLVEVSNSSEPGDGETVRFLRREITSFRRAYNGQNMGSFQFLLLVIDPGSDRPSKYR
jgi:hypothetical protein